MRHYVNTFFAEDIYSLQSGHLCNQLVELPVNARVDNIESSRLHIAIYTFDNKIRQNNDNNHEDNNSLRTI
jgi:hypothetical protein